MNDLLAAGDLSGAASAARLGFRAEALQGADGGQDEQAERDESAPAGRPALMLTAGWLPVMTVIGVHRLACWRGSGRPRRSSAGTGR